MWGGGPYLLPSEEAEAQRGRPLPPAVSEDRGFKSNQNHLESVETRAGLPGPSGGGLGQLSLQGCLPWGRMKSPPQSWGRPFPTKLLSRPVAA